EEGSLPRSGERDRGRALGQLGFVVGLDMDYDPHGRDFGLQCIFDAVADHVTVPNGHLAVHNHVKFYEGGSSGNSGPEVVYLDDILGIGGDDVTDADVFLDVDGAVHQSIQGRGDDVPSLPQDVECHEDSQCRVEHLAAGQNRPDKTCKDAHGCDDVGHDVPAVDDQCR